MHYIITSEWFNNVGRRLKFDTFPKSSIQVAMHESTLVRSGTPNADKFAFSNVLLENKARNVPSNDVITLQPSFA